MMRIRKLLSLIFLSLLYGDTTAEVDCHQKPNFSQIQSCCKLPQPNFSAYSAQCDKYNDKSKPKQTAPCFLECIYNVTKVLDGYKINSSNVRTMITSIFASSPEFIEPTVASFEKCSQFISQKLDKLKSRGGGGIMKIKQYKMIKNFPECSATPIVPLYVMCAYKNLFSSCPSTAWTATPPCEHFKEYLNTCTSRKLGKQGGGSRFRARNGSEDDDDQATDESKDLRFPQKRT